MAARRLSLLLVPCVILTHLTGCTTTRVIPPSTGGGSSSTPTPTGSYNLTISATSDGLTHTVPLTLVVN